MNFPIYRKYAGGLAFFEVLSKEEFRELKIIGRHFEVHHIHAEILPERVYIDDLINNQSGNYVSSDRKEFYRELKACEMQRIRLS